jgi:putative transposase
MSTATPAAPYSGFRFPQEIISHAVWLSFRFRLSSREVAELLADRGISVTYATVRPWGRKVGQPYATSCGGAGRDGVTRGI